MGALSQVLQIIFEVQRKMSNEKITRRELSFPIYKTCFFFPLSSNPSYFQSSYLSYFLFILGDLKCYKNAHEVLQIIFEL